MMHSTVDFNAVRREFQRERILDPDTWPLWPFLHVKNQKKQDPESPSMPLTGILTSTDVQAGHFIVRIGLIFLCYTALEFSKLPKEEFNSIDEFFAAGWVGD